MVTLYSLNPTITLLSKSSVIWITPHDASLLVFFHSSFFFLLSLIRTADTIAPSLPLFVSLPKPLSFSHLLSLSPSLCSGRGWQRSLATAAGRGSSLSLLSFSSSSCSFLFFFYFFPSIFGWVLLQKEHITHMWWVRYFKTTKPADYWYLLYQGHLLLFT